MPNYCSNIVEVDTIPIERDMQYFIPYCSPEAGCNQFVVKIKVPSNCYYILDDAPTPPPSGPCGAPGDLQHCIYLDQVEDCSSSIDLVLSLTLHYVEDPQGHALYIYTLDQFHGGNHRGGARTKKKFV